MTSPWNDDFTESYHAGHDNNVAIVPGQSWQGVSVTVDCSAQLTLIEQFRHRFFVGDPPDGFADQPVAADIANLTAV